MELTDEKLKEQLNKAVKRFDEFPEWWKELASEAQQTSEGDTQIGYPR